MLRIICLSAGLTVWAAGATAQVARAVGPVPLVVQKPLLIDGMRQDAGAAARRRAYSGYHYRATKYIYPPTVNVDGISYFYFPRQAGRKDEPTRYMAEDRYRD